MQNAPEQFESLRRRLAGSELLTSVSLEPAATVPGSFHANATLSEAGHDRVATGGPEALLDELATTAGGAVSARIAWTFSTGGADPWPDGIKRGDGMLPRIWSWLADGDEHRFLIEVDVNLAWLEGHFPQAPILAGVVQLHWAALLARGVFGVQEFPRDIVRLKFQRPVLPPAMLELRLQRIDELNVQFGYRSPGHAHSQGRLLLGAEGV